MAKATTLTRIGSNVRVQVDQVRDRIPASLLKKLKDNPRGRVIDYKMADGGGILICLIQKREVSSSRIPAPHQKRSLKNIIKEWLSR